ncbi:hypothetical protein HAX54_023217, partial [Datura stramonium]|nr:hypothetical protein [Datura stramonium]
VVEVWRYFTRKSGTGLPFPSLITLLYKRARVHREARDVMMACDMPFDSLRVKDPEGMQGDIASLAQAHNQTILKTISPCIKMPQVAREDIQWFTILSGFEDKEADELSGESDDASS